ncbi:unnamed protein product, partial [Amoebophrya sp. A25]
PPSRVALVVTKSDSIEKGDTAAATGCRKESQHKSRSSSSKSAVPRKRCCPAANAQTSRGESAANVKTTRGSEKCMPGGRAACNMSRPENQASHVRGRTNQELNTKKPPARAKSARERGKSANPAASTHRHGLFSKNIRARSASIDRRKPSRSSSTSAATRQETKKEKKSAITAADDLGTYSAQYVNNLRRFERIRGAGSQQWPWRRRTDDHLYLSTAQKRQLCRRLWDQRRSFSAVSDTDGRGRRRAALLRYREPFNTSWVYKRRAGGNKLAFIMSTT